MRLNDMPMPLGHRIEPGELFDPIRVLKSMHDEQLAFCNRLDALLDDLNPDEGTTNALLLRKFLSEHVPLYMRVEEEALVPLLYERCVSDDRLDGILEDTWLEHTVIALRLPEIAYGLGCLANGVTPENTVDFIFRSLDFIDIVRGHVSRENSTLLSLARFRLSNADCIELGLALAAACRIPYPAVTGGHDLPGFASSLRTVAQPP